MAYVIAEAEAATLHWSFLTGVTTSKQPSKDEGADIRRSCGCTDPRPLRNSVGNLSGPGTLRL